MTGAVDGGRSKAPASLRCRSRIVPVQAARIAFDELVG
jgi:hypothetical protein